MTYLETLEKFNETGMEILDIKVAIEVECFFGTENKELFEACCAEVKEVYLKVEWAQLAYITQVLHSFLNNFEDDATKISKLSDFLTYFKVREDFFEIEEM